MVAYIFETENKVTGKKFIGRNLRVSFDKKYLGDNPELASDVEKYSRDKFTVKMLRACETVKESDILLDMFTKEVENNPEYYNCIVPGENIAKSAPKRRKKKVEE